MTSWKQAACIAQSFSRRLANNRLTGRIPDGLAQLAKVLGWGPPPPPPPLLPPNHHTTSTSVTPPNLSRTRSMLPRAGRSNRSRLLVVAS